MFRKIYNLVFSPRQLSHQQEAYAALSWADSYRGWLVIVFALSWLVSIWFFKISSWSLIFWTPFYILLLLLAYRGSAAAIILLIAFWLGDKINNLAYLFFAYYKLVIVLALGLVFFPVAINALRVEFLRRANAAALPAKKTGSTAKAIGLLLLIWLAGFLSYHYYPFVRQRADFALVVQEGQTVVKNKNFQVSFSVPDNCRLDSDIVNHLIDYSLWAGQLRCQSGGDLTMFVVSDEAVSHDWQPLEGLDNVFSYDRGEMWNVIITQSAGAQRWVIGGYEYNKNIKGNIISSLKNI